MILVRTLDRYIGSTVLAAMGMVALVIVGLDFIFQFIAELNETERDYQFPQVIQYILLRLPGRIYEFVPIAALVGCLIGLGSLATRSELVVMRAAGTSIRRITWSVMQPTLVLVVAAVLIGEFVSPFADKMAETRRELARSGEAMKTSRYGHWYREGDQFMHFAAAETNGVLHGITFYQFDASNNLQAMVFAKRALYGDQQWTLEDVVESRHDRYGNKLIEARTRPWDTELTPRLLDVLFVDPDHLSMNGLYKYARYREAQGLESKSYWLAFWSKMMLPLATLSLVLVGVSFIFGPLRDGTMGFRIFMGVIIGLVFMYSQDLLGPSSLVFGFPPIVAVLAPIAVCLGIGLLLLRKSG